MKNYFSKSKILLLIIAAVLVVITAGCGTEAEDEQTETEPNNTGEQSEQTTESKDLSNEENPIVTITMENDKEIIVELYPEIAPNTVANFISLIEDGFYDGLIFHRVIPDFMIQGGDPNGNGTGGPGYGIKGEFDSNGFENSLEHSRGVISMARAMDPDSAGSQFFIIHKDSAHLDGEYAAFGQVIEGMDVVDEIVAVERDGADKPLEEQKMKSVAVDTKGVEYPAPEVK
ncbi:peptidylprolyl isomerase [Oceanobacillus bengalensis]|uniref:Peptidyl-prolyl cis-trans isomerase n=1 Tax=Oceanobacillus bengalensis TaxID=1435466 RepID=A0A494Z3U7_9BACI|nr:peptidylprolyl isomerase [Oceanobacillus bengalensis]RKQ17162.1 peptidylprolyl isomerase [Oceanobacillus bengalensis]